MRPPLHFIGMYGIGDNLHQRSVIIKLMETYDVWLETCHVWVYHDLIERGLKLILRPTSLWMHARNIEQERQLHPGVYRLATEVPRGARVVRNWYHKHEIDVHGSIVETMHAVSGVSKHDVDFRISIKDEWRERARVVLATIGYRGDKPLMIYRPIVLRKEWDGHRRNPDPQHYSDLFGFARMQRNFFVLSIASLRRDVEWIVGHEQSADYKLHDGSLEMWVMAAVFAEANLVFCNAGMAPVLAQAVGVSSIVVYGGRESFRTTQRAGAHLAPTLGVDPINPCDCHSHSHDCQKSIDVAAQLPRIMEFVNANVAVRHDLRRHA